MQKNFKSLIKNEYILSAITFKCNVGRLKKIFKTLIKKKKILVQIIRKALSGKWRGKAIDCLLLTVGLSPLRKLKK